MNPCRSAPEKQMRRSQMPSSTDDKKQYLRLSWALLSLPLHCPLPDVKKKKQDLAFTEVQFLSIGKKISLKKLAYWHKKKLTYFLNTCLYGLKFKFCILLQTVLIPQQRVWLASAAHNHTESYLRGKALHLPFGSHPRDPFQLLLAKPQEDNFDWPSSSHGLTSVTTIEPGV